MSSFSQPDYSGPLPVADQPVSARGVEPNALIGSADVADEWIFSSDNEVATPSKMEWMDQDFTAKTIQQQIDWTIDSEWAKNKWKVQAGLADIEDTYHPIISSDRSFTNLHISLKEVVLTLAGRLPQDRAQQAMPAHGNRYDNVLRVFFKVLNSGEMTPQKPGKSAVVQSLVWVRDHLGLLKAEGVSTFVIDELRDVDRSEVLDIIQLIEQIDANGLSACILQQEPVMLLNISMLGDLIAKKGRISFVVRGLLHESTESSLRFTEGVPLSQAISAPVPKRRAGRRINLPWLGEL